MHRSFSSVVAPLIEALQPRTIVETGAGAGRLTKRVLMAAGAQSAVLHAIDPSPKLDPRLLDEFGERLRIHAERSVDVIGRLGPVDLALLDGDPNWHTLRSELMMLERSAESADRAAPVVIAHHVHWPFGRRDGYHDPDAIPETERRTHTSLGLMPGHRSPSPNGLKLTPSCAVSEFEARSGVMTGIEDAISASTREWNVIDIPGFHGIAVLADARLLEEQPVVKSALKRLRSARFLRTQARHTELARLEVEVTALQERAPSVTPEIAAPVESDAPKAPAQVATAGGQSTDDLPRVPEERTSVLAELAEHRARRGALEWQMERLEEDLANRLAQVKEITAEREDERRSAMESAVRLEVMKQRLDAESATIEELRSRVSELEEQAGLRAGELRDAIEREQLAQGRLAHREDALQAAQADSNRLRAEVECMRGELRTAQALLDEVAEHVRKAEATRRARLGRKATRLWRAMTFRNAAPSHLGAALAAAERDVASPVDMVEVADSRETVPEPLDVNRQ